MSLSILDYLNHIADEAQYIATESKALTKEAFTHDETLKRAFVRSLEVIGEAVKKIPAEFRKTYDHVEWRAIAGMRDKLIHNYFGVDYEIVWDVAVNKIPLLQKDIDNIIKNYRELLE
jgi:uncharacterized protein with HEPN domain